MLGGIRFVLICRCTGGLCVAFGGWRGAAGGLRVRGEQVLVEVRAPGWVWSSHGRSQVAQEAPSGQDGAKQSLLLS